MCWGDAFDAPHRLDLVPKLDLRSGGAFTTVLSGALGEGRLVYVPLNEGYFDFVSSQIARCSRGRPDGREPSRGMPRHEELEDGRRLWSPET